MSVISKLASYDNDIDFRRIWRVGIALSIAAVVISVGALVFRGLNLGIDFEGGNAWIVEAPDVSVADARDALSAIGEGDAKIQTLNSESAGQLLRVQTEPSTQAEIDAVTEALAELTGVTVGDIDDITTVGPTWGDEITAKAQRALLAFFVLIALYITVRLEWKMALGALLAVVHDIGITVGIYSLFQIEVTPATVIAILTILGYSLYDTIVVYDKIQENTERPAVAQKHAYTDLVSLSLNQVLMRSLNTTITSLLPVLAMLFVGSFLLGAVTLQEFAVALAIGLVTGAYSSIFVATPFVAWIKEREPYYRNLRSRLATQADRRSANVKPETPSTAAADAEATAEADGDGATRAPSGGTDVPLGPSGERVIPPRPRKKGKRR